MMTEEYERRILEHLNILWEARGTPQPVIAKALRLGTATGLETLQRPRLHIRG